jgi:aminoglycoside phosphotransferase (APT) family kinase protein
MSNEVPELKAILIRNIKMHELLPAESKKKIIDYLERLPDGTMLCHGDYHPDNILLQDGKAFVLDWMTASRGNPQADVARTSVLLQWAQPGPGTPRVLRALLGTVRNKFYNRYIHHYLQLSGARLEDIERWELPVMAARLMEWIPKTEKELLISKINEKLKVI